MQKCSAKYRWHRCDNNVQYCTEDVKNMLRSLMKTQTIDAVGLSQLKADGYPLYNPTLIMDLRHKTKSVNRKLINYRNNDVMNDAQRMIKAEEMEKLTVEKELQSIDIQINNFQKSLDDYRLKMNRNFRCKNTGNKNRQCETYKISVADMEEVLQESISYNERQKNKQISSLALVPNFSSLCVDSCVSESNLHSLENMVHKQQNGADIDVDLNSFKIISDNSTLLYDHNLILKIWNRWRAFINEKKLINATHQEVSLNESNAELNNKKLLNKYFILWYSLSKKEKLLKHATEKMQQKQKINKFLATLKESKQTIRNKNMKTLIEFKSKSANNISKCLLDAGSSQRKEIGNKQNSRALPHYLAGSRFKHRFQAQKIIIAEQKSKLEEQRKVIEELQLAQLNKDGEKCQKICQEHLSQTLQNCNTVLKPRAKYLCHSMPLEIVNVPESRQNAVSALIIQPRFPSKMAERAQERQKRWKLIQEKKRILKEEKQRQEREKEQKILQQEKEERKRMIEIVQRLKIIEKEKEIKRQQEKERLKALNKKSLEYHRTYLLRKFGINAFKTMIALRNNNFEKADAHYRKQLLCRHFIAWKAYIQSYTEWKICQADKFYRSLLMKSSFRRLKENFYDYKLKRQVALDFYDFHVQKWAFTEWRNIVCLIHVEHISKMEKARLHYERKLSMKCLHQWVKFPEIKLKEKQRELKKEFWRSKVQELLPDFRPVLCTSEMISYHSYLY